jgi:phage regulator Rha-like protein
VAELYGVPKREVNRAVKNNPEKFLKGYVIELNSRELSSLRWKNSTTNAAKRRSMPMAFTEKGLYMLATILKSKQATQATLQIVETFTKVREFSKVAKSLAVESDTEKKERTCQKKWRTDE